RRIPQAAPRERSTLRQRRQRPREPAPTISVRASSECLLPRILARDLLELLDRFFFGLRELLRHGQVDARDQVALAGALELRRAAAADPQELPVLRPGRNL